MDNWPARAGRQQVKRRPRTITFSQGWNHGLKRKKSAPRDCEPRGQFNVLIVNYENVDQSIGIEFLDFDLVWEEFAGLKIRRLVL